MIIRLRNTVDPHLLVWIEQRILLLRVLPLLFRLLLSRVRVDRFTLMLCSTCSCPRYRLAALVHVQLLGGKW